MKKENIPVVIAIALPVVLILIVAALVYFPGAGSKPTYNFLYTENAFISPYAYQNGQCIVYSNYYEIDEDHLVEKPFASAGTTTASTGAATDAGSSTGVPSPAPQNIGQNCYGSTQVIKKDLPPLYLYDSAINTSSIISYGDAAKLTLIDGLISPDNYTVGGSYDDAGILDLFGGGQYGMYATQNNHRVKLSIPQTDAYGSGDFSFMAWVSH